MENPIKKDDLGVPLFSETASLQSTNNQQRTTTNATTQADTDTVPQNLELKRMKHQNGGWFFSVELWQFLGYIFDL